MGADGSDPQRIGEEVVVNLGDGYSIRSGSSLKGYTSGEYVRICDKNNEELIYWSYDEWRDDPILVVGAILNVASHLQKNERTNENY